MSQYAYIPASAQQQLPYTIVWQFELNGVQYTGFEEPVFTQAQKDEIASLGGQWFLNAQGFQEWTAGTSPRARRIRRQRRCQEVEERYLEENMTITISPQDSATFLQQMLNVSLLLQKGEARAALGAVMAVDPSAFPIGAGLPYATTEERKQSFVLELQSIVSDPALFDQA